MKALILLSLLFSVNLFAKENSRKAASIVEKAKVFELEVGRTKTALICPNRNLIAYIENLECTNGLSPVMRENGVIKLVLNQCKYSESLSETIEIQPSAGCMLVRR